MAWKARISCPHCGKERDFLSYKIQRRDQVFKKTAECFHCGKWFTIKSSRQDNIIREINYNRWGKG